MQSHHALREREERYRGTVERSPQPIAVHSEGQLVYINPAGGRMLAAGSPEELIGRWSWEQVHPAYRGLAQARARQTQQEGRVAPVVEQKFLRLDGSIVDVEVVGIPAVYGGRQATQVIFWEITDHKRTDVERTQLAREQAARAEAEAAQEQLAFLARASEPAGELARSPNDPAAGRATGGALLCRLLHGRPSG